jgi:uncharacterized protein (TIGR02001 family)
MGDYPMKRMVWAATAALLVTAAPALAADLGVVTKAPVIAPAPSPWDIAFGGSIHSDYNFRGISQTDRKPGVFAYFEPRYNINPNLQLYAGLSGYSIDFPNRAAAEIDIYGGIRPTIGPLAFDLGIWYYYYPGGQCFNSLVAGCFASLPNGNVAKKDFSFIEYYGKVAYTFAEVFNVGAGVYYSPNWLNTGAPGTYGNLTAKYTLPSTILPSSIGAYVSGELGRYWLGTTDAFYFFTPLPDYTYWNAGIGFTYKVFTLDLRYHDTNLNQGDCNALTSAHTAGGFTNVTVANPGGAGTNWCDATFIAKLSFDLTLANLK